MLDGSVTDVVEGSSLAFRQDHIDIYSSSWGPDDNGRTLDGPGPLAERAFKQGTETVRGGEQREGEGRGGEGGREGRGWRGEDVEEECLEATVHVCDAVVACVCV